MRKPPPPSSDIAKLAITATVAGLAAVVFSRNFLETEKKISELIVTDYGVMDPPFVRTMSQLLGPPLVPGNEVKILQNGAQIFPRMVEAIQSAQRSVTFENFVLVDGTVARAFAEALCERARNGVKVHFLQDAVGCNCLHGDLMHQLRTAGVEVEIFRYYSLTRFNHRTHRKLLVVDGRFGFVGGAGISDAWDGNADRPDRWRDTQYEVHGPAVGQMQQAFLDNWVQTRSCVLHGEDYFPEIPPAGNTVCQIFKSSVTEGADSARLMFLFSIAAARESIRIVNPYFIPDSLVLRMLLEARRRGVSIEIIAPSDRIDQRIVRYVGRARWGALLQAGVRIFEYQPALLHCKYFVVDNHWASVGSCNLDDRSLCLNEEANLNVWDEAFAREHMRVFEEDKSRSTEVTLRDWRRRPMREKIIGHVAGILRSQL
ncbi:MAG: phospholipase D-like domain-containing protein [Prosthecobacter sp.]|nr:phospholipase D-like domain-containing protein [Prosthecobacter sp.]